MVPYPFVQEDVPVFKKSDVDWYGMPELYGIERYRVVEEVQFGSSLYSEQQVRELRPIHHYDRLQRFGSIVRKLLGNGPVIPVRVLEEIKNRGLDQRGDHVWNDVRFQLKQMGKNKWYNHIPEIIAYCHHPLKMRTEEMDLDGLFLAFKKMSWKFDHTEWGDRRYFPNLRYVALRLLVDYGVWFEYYVPILQTPRKYPLLDQVWNELTEEKWSIPIKK
jgi:hypothetical protein